jgi:hypothetical protein
MIYQGDNGRVIPITTSVDLTDATVTVTIMEGLRKFTKECTITDASKGICKFTLNSEDLVNAGYYFYQAEIIKGDEKFSLETVRFEVGRKLGVNNTSTPGTGDVDGGGFESSTNNVIDGGEF